jgi:hypothetical protein
MTMDEYLRSRCCDCEQCRVIRAKWERILPQLLDSIRNMNHSLSLKEGNG